MNVIQTPFVRYADSRRRWVIVSNEYSMVSNISGIGAEHASACPGGRPAAPIFLTGPSGLPRLYSCAQTHAVAGRFDAQPLGQGVHDAHADAVQAAGDLVAAAAELAAGVEDRVHDLERVLAGRGACRRARRGRRR